MGPSWEWGSPKAIMGLPYMASNGLIFKDFFGKAQTFKKAKGLIFKDFFGKAWAFKKAKV